MKKLALALVASSFSAGIASAEISTGFYLGAGVVGNSTTMKGTNAASVAPAVPAASASLGGHNAQMTLFGGYGFVTGCTYIGGELGFTFLNNKINSSIGTVARSYERKNVIKAALIAGQKFSASTMGYVRLGLNNAQYISTETKGKVQSDPLKSRKFSFAPGLGLETALNKNTLVRLECEYDLGAKFKDSEIKARSQSITLGLAHKI